MPQGLRPQPSGQPLRGAPFGAALTAFPRSLPLGLVRFAGCKPIQKIAVSTSRAITLKRMVMINRYRSIRSDYGVMGRE